MTTIEINEPGLQQHSIEIEPTSIANLAKHDTGAAVWHALWVDGQPYDLVQVAHCFGRPEHITAMQRVVDVVTAAIKEQTQGVDHAHPAFCGLVRTTSS